MLVPHAAMRGECVRKQESNSVPCRDRYDCKDTVRSGMRTVDDLRHNDTKGASGILKN